MKAYSLDLRKKIVQRYEAGAVTQRELAKQFGVSTFFVVKLLPLRRRGQSITVSPINRLKNYRQIKK